MLIEFLKSIPDHRDRQARQYDLAHILMFTVLAVLSNAKTYKDVFEFMESIILLIQSAPFRSIPSFIKECLILIKSSHTSLF